MKPEEFRYLIETAASLINPYVRSTPVINLAAGDLGLEYPITLKLECLQYTGSFKPRGAFNRLLSNKIPASGVNAASGGNHGIAVAYAAKVLGCNAEIFVPEISSPVKIQRLSDYGAEVNIIGCNYAEALAASKKRVEKTGALVVHAYDQKEAISGQGTVARELEIQEGTFDTVIASVGGAGLIAGIAAWYQGKTRIVGVEPVSCPTLYMARMSGGPVDVDTAGLAADSLGARRVGEYGFEIAEAFIERLLLVEDNDIRDAQRLLWKELRIITEPGGAAALAALTSASYRPQTGERVAIIICGSNTDPTKLSV